MATALLLTGCASHVSVSRTDLFQQFERRAGNILTSDTLSERTRTFIRMHDNEDAWRSDPMALLRSLDSQSSAAPDRDMLFVLMELCFDAARNERVEDALVPRLYLSCAVYAYSYLFDPRYGVAPSPYHPHSRLACDMYNRALAAYIKGILASGKRYQPGMPHPLLSGTLVVLSRASNLAWQPTDFDRFDLAFEYDVAGLEPLYRTYGIGVPLIAVRKATETGTNQYDGGFIPGIQQTCAATAFLRINPAHDTGSGVLHTAIFEFLDPTKTDSVAIDGQTVPLETDFTTPLAYMIAHTPEPAGIRAAFDVDIWAQQEGLHMLQPYQPGRIPVVFVHGLMSSPMTWLPMLNTLMGDPVLNKRYQFWFFMYPTGNPILYSASLLRNSLHKAHRLCDPESKDPAFDQMVVVGHSMGGLLTKFNIQDSGTQFWSCIADKPLDSYPMPADQRTLISNIMFFSALPYPTRVLYLATPHRGSGLAHKWYSRLGASITRLGRNVNSLGDTLVPMLSRHNQGSASQVSMLDLGRIPTGIDGLMPENPVLMLSAEMPISPRVTFHSIIGNDEGTEAGGTDGVVPYWSSHLDGAASEKVVKSGHSVQEHPSAIYEVRRILLEHLKAVDAKP